MPQKNWKKRKVIILGHSNTHTHTHAYVNLIETEIYSYRYLLKCGKVS